MARQTNAAQGLQYFLLLESVDIWQDSLCVRSARRNNSTTETQLIHPCPDRNRTYIPVLKRLRPYSHLHEQGVCKVLIYFTDVIVISTSRGLLPYRREDVWGPMTRRAMLAGV
jgi:hypothetical protein